MRHIARYAEDYWFANNRLNIHHHIKERKMCNDNVSKIKVVFCIPDMVIGGVETVFKNTLESLLKNPNLDVSILTHTKIREPLHLAWLKDYSNVKIHVYYPLCNFYQDLMKYCRVPPLKQLRKIIFSLYKKYRRLVGRRCRFLREADVLIDYKNFEFARELKHFKKPKIAWMHSALSYFEQSGLIWRADGYDALVVLTDECAVDLKKAYPQYSLKVVRIYNPINAKDIIEKSKIASCPDGRYFCHVSRLAPGKDIKTLLDAFDLFAATNDDVRLFIVGDGPLRAEFEAYAAGLSVSSRIIFMGAQNNPYSYMRGAVANILSSEFEGLPTVVLESVVLGVPVISSDCKCGPKEILLNGRGGMLFQIGNARQLADEMERTLRCADDIDKMKKIASSGLKRFAPDVIASKISNLVMGLYNG